MRRASNQSANRSELPAFLIFIRPKGHRLATYVFSPRPPPPTPQSRPFHKTGPPLNACPTSPLTKNRVKAAIVPEMENIQHFSGDTGEWPSKVPRSLRDD